MAALRYGIMSTSSIAPRFIAAVRASASGEIVAVSSRTMEKAEEKAAQWKIPKAYGSHEALLEDQDVDIVYISAVNSAHYKWAKAALEAGKHVICEKPCTTTEEKTRELFALAKERDLFLMEAQKMLFLPAVLAAKQAIDEGRLGKIHMAEFNHSFYGSYNNWMYDEAAGGGPLLSSAIYVVELLQFLFGCEIAEVVTGDQGLDTAVHVGEHQLDGVILVLNGGLEGFGVGGVLTNVRGNDLYAKMIANLFLTGKDCFGKCVTLALLYPVVFGYVTVVLDVDVEGGTVVLFRNIGEILGFGFCLSSGGFFDLISCLFGGSLYLVATAGNENGERHEQSEKEGKKLEAFFHFCGFLS